MALWEFNLPLIAALRASTGSANSYYRAAATLQPCSVAADQTPKRATGRALAHYLNIYCRAKLLPDKTFIMIKTVQLKSALAS